MRDGHGQTQRGIGRTTLTAALPGEWRTDRPLQAEQPPNERTRSWTPKRRERKKKKKKKEETE
jgi:hypothetical protein